MDPQTVVTIGREALTMVLLISSPLLVSALVVGVTISIFQAITSIQEMTLTFIPKILAVMIALVVFFPWMMRVLLNFTEKLFVNIPMYIR